MRRIIQIASCAWASDVTTEDGGAASWLFALCDDGTLWRRDAERLNTQWTEVAGVPGSDTATAKFARAFD
jgi:hypothetical protein